MPRSFLHLRVALIAVSTMALPVFAQIAVPATLTDHAAPSPESDLSADNAFPTGALDDAALGGVAGREDTSQVSMANLNAGVSRNTVGANSTTGDARISDNAFQNLSGLSILNVNTGNNVAINAAMNVNISIKPGP